MKFWFRFLSIVIVAMLLSSCVYKKIHPHPPTLLQHRDQLAQQIEAQGVQVISHGDTVRIILPADDFFIVNSPRLTTQGKAKLNLIASYLYMSPTVSIKVLGFTDSLETPNRKLALTQARADRTLKQIWGRNIDVRIMSAEGMADSYPVADNQTAEGREANRRIEIMLRKYAV